MICVSMVSMVTTQRGVTALGIAAAVTSRQDVLTADAYRVGENGGHTADILRG